MDFFGIGQAMVGVAEVYFRGARGTGRTENLIKVLRDGDRVFTTSSVEGDVIKMRARDNGVTKVDVVPTDADTIEGLRMAMERTPVALGRVFVDHTLLERIYIKELRYMAASMSMLEKESGGFLNSDWPRPLRNPQWEI
jgi:preprotein translocase subunit YajC